MDNLLRLIRQHNIFGSPSDSNTSPNNQMGFDNPVDDYDAAGRMQELYQPQFEASDRYNSTLEAMPVRGNPNIWRKLAAIGSSFSPDPTAVERTLYSPYHRQMQDWGTKIKAYEPAAQLERQNNTNMRGIANQIVSQEQGSRRLERQYSRDATMARQGDARIAQADEKLKDADRRIAQADERLKISKEVAKGGQLKIDDFGTAMIVRKDGTTIPVKGEYLSFEEKEALKAETAKTKSAGTIKTDVIDDPDNPGRKVLVRINPDGTYSIIKGKDTGASATPRSRSETSTATQELGVSRGITNKAQQIKNSNPRWNKFVKIVNGKVEIVKPGIFSGPSKEEYDQIYNAIFGGQPQTMGSPGGRGSGPGKQTNTNIPAGKVRVRRKSDGSTGMMDANDPQLNSGKYERIQ